MNLFTDTFRIPLGYFSTAVDPTGALVATAFGPKELLSDRLARCHQTRKFHPPGEDEEQTVLWGWGAHAPVSELTGARAPHPHERFRLMDDRSAGRFVREQVLAYFAGERREFELPLAPGGTDFQQRVWAALQRIPFGETRSYGQLAAGLGNPAASRAVGRANARNPICLIVPCHRVIGADGSLTGFAFGEEIKRRLLEHERVVSAACAGFVMEDGIAQKRKDAGVQTSASPRLKRSGRESHPLVPALVGLG
jgi:methylated-DNA-[protein]-cysteine S-methyltransferase